MGDTLPHDRLKDVDGKSAFTGDLDKNLAEGKVDAVVHSMKDLPSELDPRLTIAATPERGDARDAFVSKSGGSIQSLHGGDKVGTSSVRRQAQLLRLRPDIKVVELHGNIGTRLERLEGGDLSGIVLAAAGLQRLGLGSRISQTFGTDEIVPAVCQGTMAVEARKDDLQTRALLEKIDDPPTRASSECERAFAAALGGDCNVPLGAFAAIQSGTLRAIGMVADPAGNEMARAEAAGPPGEAVALGRSLAAMVEEAGGRRILRGLAH